MRRGDPQARPRAQVDTLVRALFDRYPDLIGFGVQDPGDLRAMRSTAELTEELCLVDVETFPDQGDALSLLAEIAAALLELIDEAPETRALLRGRTFARTLH